MRKFLIGIGVWFSFLTALGVAFYEEPVVVSDSSSSVLDSFEPTSSEVDSLVQEDSDPAYLFVADDSSLLRSANGAFYLYGSTSDNCSRIVVDASNISTGLSDSYQLTEYSYGDTDFEYGLREDWNNLAAGTTSYTFTAYCDGQQVKTFSYSVTVPTSSYTYSDTSSSYNSYDYGSTYDTDVDHYVNVDGDVVQSPTYYSSVPAGASAQCNDGTYSFSKHRQGTCSGHGGVDVWY